MGDYLIQRPLELHKIFLVQENLLLLAYLSRKIPLGLRNSNVIIPISRGPHIKDVRSLPRANFDRIHFSRFHKTHPYAIPAKVQKFFGNGTSP